MERGDQRHQNMIHGQAAQDYGEPALRKIRNIEGADKHQAGRTKAKNIASNPFR